MQAPWNPGPFLWHENRMHLYESLACFSLIWPWMLGDIKSNLVRNLLFISNWAWGTPVVMWGIERYFKRNRDNLVCMLPSSIFSTPSLMSWSGCCGWPSTLSMHLSPLDTLAGPCIIHVLTWQLSRVERCFYRSFVVDTTVMVNVRPQDITTSQCSYSWNTRMGVMKFSYDLYLDLLEVLSPRINLNHNRSYMVQTSSSFFFNRNTRKKHYLENNHITYVIRYSYLVRYLQYNYLILNYLGPSYLHCLKYNYILNLLTIYTVLVYFYIINHVQQLLCWNFYTKSFTLQ